ncbi:MAG: PLDc_N domain-containing protein [Gammaproteobacteria bacterium]|nr:MAG: PLDc_N domain-containing protein [Gammaproteobacteria bacterium]
METIVGVLILLADIYAILQIAQSSATTGSKAIWILVVLLLPVMGVIAWYFAGPKS